MTVNTGKVEGRRKLQFKSLQEVLADAEQLVAAPQVVALGNWTPAQVLFHLANTMNKSIDGFAAKAPWFVRLFGKVIRKRILTKPMPSGFKLPPPMAKELIADDSAAKEEAIAALHSAIDRLDNESHREPHPVFGRLTCKQWNQLHMRHSELHLSFLVPE